MAIQVPIPNDPQAPQAVNPLPFVSEYLNRQQQGFQDTLNRTQYLGETVNKLKQQKIQNELGALGAYASIAKAVGPDAANQVAGQIPNLPKWGQTMAPQSQPLSSDLAPMPTQSFQPSEHIQSSVAAGAPDFTGHLAKIRDLQGQLSNFSNKGDWGREQAQQVAQQIVAEKTAMDAEMAPQDYASKSQTERLATDKPISEEISKQRAKTTLTDTADTLYKQFSDTFLSADEKGNQIDLTKPSTKVPFIGGAASEFANKTGGRYGNVAGGDMLDKGKTLAPSIASLLSSTGRMSPEVAKAVADGMIPKPDMLTSQKMQKMQDIRSLIDTVRAGDQQALDDVISTLKGQGTGRTPNPTNKQDTKTIGNQTFVKKNGKWYHQ